jgi:Fe-S-cluster containining protein
MLGGALPLKPDGSCMNLRADNSCAIYEVRPEICRVRGDFAANAQWCNQWQSDDRMAESFRVSI